MLEQRLQEGLTFDDLLIVPGYAAIIPKDVDIRTRLTETISLGIPILSAAMDTVTEAETAIVMAQEGGFGVIHKNWSIEAQSAEVRKVKKYESGVVVNPITVSSDQTLEQVEEIARSAGVTGFPVVEGKRLVGMLTSRDRMFEDDLSKCVRDCMTPAASLITAMENVDLEEAKKLLHSRRIEKLPIVNTSFELLGLMTTRDILRVHEHPNATKDSYQRLRVGAAVGVAANDRERAEALIAAQVDLIVVDTAHGHSKGVITMVRDLRTMSRELQIVAGNVATEEGTKALIEAGANAVKIGVGPGSICTTRIVAGCGVPQVSAIANCARIAQKKNVPLIADGGVKYSGEIVKALAVGADVVMIGSLFAGTEEAPGEIVIYQGRSYKVYRGMGSLEAMRQGSGDRYAQGHVKEISKMVPEGIEGRVPYRGKLRDSLFQLVGGLRSGMGYAGCPTLQALKTETKFVRVTAAGLRESHVHDVIITKESPNYQME